MLFRLVGVLGLLTVTAGAFAQSAATGHVGTLQLQIGACEAQHKVCSRTCATGAECEQCDKEWLDCKANLPVDVNALNVRQTGGGPDGGGSPRRQNDRWHEIDGCSLPDWVPDWVRDWLGPDDPVEGKWGNTSTRFGAPQGHGDCNVMAPDEKALDLPCNKHDICYQTCGSSRANCDQEMLEAMLRVCNNAYHGTSCPFPAARPCPVADDMNCDGVCTEWYDERERCSKTASRIKGWLDRWGGSFYKERQEEYCAGVDAG